jgi:hypothetical protein
MKTALLFLTASVVAAVAYDPVPKAFEKGRYAPLFEKSPFWLETKIQPPGPAAEDPFAGAYITSLSLDGDGRTVVYVRRPGSAEGIKLVGTEPDDASGYAVVSVNWTRKLKDATVVAKHASSGQEQTLRFSDKPFVPTGIQEKGKGTGKDTKRVTLRPVKPGTIPPTSINDTIRPPRPPRP